jgi:hypothetical protein
MDFIYSNRRKKLLTIALSGVVDWGSDNGGDLTNVQYKSNWNCDCESPIYKYILIFFLKSRFSPLELHLQSIF